MNMNDPRFLYYSVNPGPRPNLLVRILMALAAVALFAVSIFLGAMVFLALLGLSLIAAVVFSVRLWWLRRQMLAAQRRGQDAGSASPREPGARRTQIHVIEGRYRREED